MSSAGDFEAAAVTLHPWDTYEYTLPASERCHVIFLPLKSSSPLHSPYSESEQVVTARSLQFVLSKLATQRYRWNRIDRNIVQAYHALALSHPAIAPNANKLEKMLENIALVENGEKRGQCAPFRHCQFDR